MKQPLTKVLTLIFLIINFLVGEEAEEPILFVDSINLQSMTDLKISGKDSPLTIIKGNYFDSLFFNEKSVFKLSDMSSGEYTSRAIIRLQDQIVESLVEAGYGIAVVVDPAQINIQTSDDFRKEGDKSLNIQIWIGEVVKSRTVGKGKRIKETNLINHPLHRKILEKSPFAVDSKAERFLIDKPALDDYLERLNQDLRRRVDIAISSAGEPGKLVLDYIISESKPWTIYIQTSNTGTEATGEWRERIGGTYYQLTNNDDVLTVDYLTAEFDRANAAVVSYEYPLLRPNYLTSITYGRYSDFAAENLQIHTRPASIGETISFGSELVYTPFYWKGHAVSAVSGLLQEDIEFETPDLRPPESRRPVWPQNDRVFRFFRICQKNGINSHRSLICTS